MKLAKGWEQINGKRYIKIRSVDFFYKDAKVI